MDIIQGLDPASRSALAALFANGGRLEHPLTLKPTDLSIRDLNETLIRLSPDLEGRSHYIVVHPPTGTLWLK